MSEKTFRYRVTVDVGDVARAAAETRRAFSQEMNRMPIGGPVGSPSGAGGAGGLLGDLGKMRSFLAGGVLGFGVSQLAQVGMQMGQLGAANQRTQKSFEGLAEGANMASDSLLNRLRSATQGAVTSQRLMASSNMLLLGAQNGQIQTTEKQIETLAKFARLRSQQLGVSTEEAYSRLVLGISKREPELLDELAVSAKSISAALGVSVQEINKSTNTFYQGVIKVAEQEIAKFGEPALDDAAKLAQATTQMTEAWDKLAIAAAKPVAFTVTLVADGINEAGGIVQGLGDAWNRMQNPATASVDQLLLGTRGAMTQMQDRAMTGDVTDAQVDAYQRLRENAERYEQALDELNHIEGISQRRIVDSTQDVNKRNVAFAKADGVIRSLSASYAGLVQLDQAGMIDPAVLTQAQSGWQAIVAGIDNGTLSLDDAIVKARELLAVVNGVATAAGAIGPQLGTSLMAAIPSFVGGDLQKMFAQARFNQVVAGNVAPDSLNDDEKKYRLAVGDTAEKLAIYQHELDGLTGASQNLTDVSQDAYDVMVKIAGLKGQLDAENERKTQETRDRFSGLLNAQLGLRMAQNPDPASQIALLQSYRSVLLPNSKEDLDTQTRIESLQQRMIEDTRQEWRRTAQEVERNFEAAADKIMGIPGVTSLTPVTERDMADAELGIYRDKPDEWMHRVRDELLNGVDYPDVTREQVARLAGLPADMPAEALISRVEGRWGTGSLFADPANLDLLNMDAIRGQYEEMKAGAVGRQNQRQYIMEQLGIGAADAALLTGTQAPLVQMLTGGQSTEEIAAQLGGVGALVNQAILAPQTVTTGPSPLISMYTGGLTADELAAQLDGIGATLSERLLAPQVVTDGQSPLVRMYTGGLTAEELAAQLDGIGATLSERLLAPQVVMTGPSPLMQMLTGGQSNDEIAEQLGGLGTTITERVLAPLQSGGLVKSLARGWEVDVRDNYKKLYGPIDSLAGSVNERLDEKIGAGLKIVDIVVARVLEEIADDL